MQLTLPTLLACLALTPGLISAVPTSGKREPINAESAKEILATLELENNGTDIGFNALARRSQLDNRDRIPDCSLDPSLSIPKNSGYSVDQGVKIPKKGPDDHCTTGHRGDHCWTEQWLVETQIEYNDWANTGYAIDCAQTSSCSSATIELGQSCSSHSTADDNGFEVGIEAKFEYAFAEGKKITIGTQPKYQFKRSDGDTTSMCTTESGRATCNFDDDKCHSIWSAQRNKRVYGYYARVCNGEGGSNVQMNQQNANGRWVRGIVDFSFLIPINKLVGCAAKCGDQTYPDPTPIEGNGRIPFEADW